MNKPGMREAATDVARLWRGARRGSTLPDQARLLYLSCRRSALRSSFPALTASWCRSGVISEERWPVLSLCLDEAITIHPPNAKRSASIGSERSTEPWLLLKR